MGSILLRGEVHEEVKGLRLHGDIPHSRYLRKLSAGRAEPFMLKLFQEHLPEGRDVVDVGGYLGLYALIAAQSPQVKRVWAFEPDPRNFGWLARNIRENESRVEAQPFVVGDRQGTARIQLSRGGQSQTHVSEEGGVAVRSVALDQFLPEDVDPALIKIDVEGHEVAALAGMKGILERCRPILFVEHHARSLRRQGSSPEKLLELLAQLDYRVAWIDEEQRCTKPPATLPDHDHVNLICEPR